MRRRDLLLCVAMDRLIACARLHVVVSGAVRALCLVVLGKVNECLAGSCLWLGWIIEVPLPGAWLVAVVFFYSGNGMQCSSPLGFASV